jgi:hypothetical protein
VVDPIIEREIFEQLTKLPTDQQRRVLEFARALGTEEVVGVPGRALLRFAGMIGPEDLREMAAVIEEDCERVDVNEW